MRPKQEYMNMNELGLLFAVSGKQAGKWLKELGLRDRFGNPTQRAYDEKLTSYDYERHGTYTTLWHAEKVVTILEQAGHRRSGHPPELLEAPKLVGPFSIREADHNTWQLVGNDGEVAIVVTGDANARAVQRVMNIAHRAGMLEKSTEVAN